MAIELGNGFVFHSDGDVPLTHKTIDNTSLSCTRGRVYANGIPDEEDSERFVCVVGENGLGQSSTIYISLDAARHLRKELTVAIFEAKGPCRREVD